MDHLPEDEGDGVGLLVQVEAHLGPDVVIEVDAALGAGHPPLRLPPIPPQLQSERVWNKLSSFTSMLSSLLKWNFAIDSRLLNLAWVKKIKIE